MMKNSHVFAALMGVSCLGCSSALAQDSGMGAVLSKPPGIERDRQVIEVPMDVRMGKLFIDATVESETRAFIFDTGSPTILTTDLAKALNLEIMGQNTGRDANGREVTMDVAVVETLAIGGLTFHNVPVLIFDPHQLELGACILDGGVIGSEILPGSVWTMDTEQGRLTVSAPGAATDSREASLTARLHDFGYPHTPVVDYSVGDVRDKAIFDTGSADEVVLFEGVADSKKVRRSIAAGTVVKGRGSDGVSAGGPGDIRDLHRFTLPEFHLGKDSIGPVRATTRETAPTLIGAAILDRYAVTLDYAAGQFILTDRASPMPRAPEPGYSVSVVNGAVTVTRLYEGTLAEQAGLRLGDQVTSINGHAFRDLDTGPVCEEALWLADTFDRTARAELVVERAGGPETIRIPKMVH
ncbi:hypothetical protein HY30_06265 [Hyphomonas chukchiensis]|uniref:PDZ domain-containing protein n=2 Tax=Hyphomonas chukchiensis TaxID=1280947 RepID=A0A062UGA4_9PROT|nr:hypothetical protein HY30_06265 [Hyphomonas chukchiensis]